MVERIQMLKAVTMEHQKLSKPSRTRLQTVLDRAVRAKAGARILLLGDPAASSLAAAWLANRLAKPLYRVDLSSIVSQYIGETEKNLERLISDAEQADAVLFFDEADALLDKREEVRESRDRYANQDTRYLLSRIEQYSGLTILASNARAGIDRALPRKFALMVDLDK